jgi:hypothetical protein
MWLRADRWSRLVALAVTGGILVRFLNAYPPHVFPADADAILVGWRALSLLQGKLVAFHSSMRVGALECYVDAALFAVFGVSRGILGVAPFLWGSLQVYVFFLLARRIVSRPAAVLSTLFMAFPSSYYLFATYLPVAYGLIMLLGTATLWLAAVASDQNPRKGAGFLLGLTAGLALWTSLQSLAFTVPAALFASLRLRSPRRWADLGRAAIPGLLIGALPWLVANVRYPLGSFQDPVSGRAVHTLRAAAANLDKAAVQIIPDLVAQRLDELPGVSAVVGPAVKAPVRVLHLLALVGVLGVFWVVSRRQRQVERGEGFGADAGVLVVGVAGISLLQFCVLAQAFYGPTHRYLLPLYLAVPFMLGVFVDSVRRRSATLAFVVVGALVLFNLTSYLWPFSSVRPALRQLAVDQRIMIRSLERAGVRVVTGDYWDVNALNFVAHGSIAAVPVPAPEIPNVPAVPVGVFRVALVARDRARLDGWLRRCDLMGDVNSPSPGYWVFTPRDQPGTHYEAVALLQRLRSLITP